MIQDREAMYPAGTATYSKARNQFPQNAPRFARIGQGAKILCDDNRWYIDYTMGLGAVSLGYGDYDVERAILARLQRGSIFGLPTEIEFEFAEEFVSVLPWEDAAVKYGKNGSDATTAAVRAARALTGRDTIVSQGYHGYADFCVPNKNGVPVDVRALTHEYTTPDEIGAPACVIVEPDAIAVDLPALRRACDSAGAVLIFDEMLTGFRVAMPGYMSYSGVVPDMACFGKAISNGMPLSVVCGAGKFMEPFGGAIGYSFTYGGETLSLAAGLATVRKYKREPVIERLWEVGGRLRGCWELACQAYELDMPLEGLAPRTVVKWPSLAHRTLVSQEMFKRGICFTVGFTVSYAHSDADVDQTQVAIKEVLELVASVEDPATLVVGPIVSHKPFRTMTA